MSTIHTYKGGVPITYELAKELRQVVFGSSTVPLKTEWTQTPFQFSPARKELSYGLLSTRNATRGLLTVVQGFILKYLLFDSRAQKYQLNNNPLLTSADGQKSALIVALVEILRNIADKGKIIVVVPAANDETFVQHSSTYLPDSITEKLYMFSVNPHDELEGFLKQHYKSFTEEGSAGALLLLYSAVLTRTICKLRSDLDTTKSIPLTMANDEEGSLMIVTLLLTGRATPYIHNGVVNVGDEKTYALPQYGVLKRCTIGLLMWENNSAQSDLLMLQPGSRLKTPNFPIWISNCNGHYGVMFNSNSELLCNYHAESCFDMIYYNCSGNDLTMTIDNRSYNEQAICMLERQVSVMEGHTLLNASNSEFGSKEDISSSKDEKDTVVMTPLLKLIHTKWEEAFVICQSQPLSMGYLFTPLYNENDPQ